MSYVDHRSCESGHVDEIGFWVASVPEERQIQEVVLRGFAKVYKLIPVCLKSCFSYSPAAHCSGTTYLANAEAGG